MAQGLLLRVDMARAEGSPLADAIPRNPGRLETRALDQIAACVGPDGLTADGIAADIAPGMGGGALTRRAVTVALARADDSS